MASGSAVHFGGPRLQRAALVAMACCLLLFMASPLPAQDDEGGSRGWGEMDQDLMQEMDEELSSGKGPAVADPLEPYNRLVFSFNDSLYTHVLMPVSNGYKAVVEENFRSGISNAFYNIAMPGRVVNNVLQGRPVRGAKEIAAFAVNTLLGFGGLLKPSQGIPALDPSPPEKDVGTTLATWGLGEGIYIVWPVLGPSTLRSSAGMVGDYFLDPLTYYPEERYVRWGISAGENLNELPSYMDLYREMKGFAVEPYTAVKDGYVQYRRGKVRK